LRALKALSGTSWRSALLAGAALGALGFILLPIAFVIWLSVFAQELPVFPPQGYSLRWFGAIFEHRQFVAGFVTSLQVGTVATLTGLALGVPAALALARMQGGAARGLNQLLLLPLVVPGVVLGTALYIFHVEAEILAYGQGHSLAVIGSLGGLVAAHVLIVIPWTVRLVLASLAGLDRSVEEAALNLGATPWVAFRRVTLPMIRPGIVAAALFGFVMSFGNLEMSLFLVGPGRTTLPIAILQYLEWKLDPTIAAVSVLQMIVIATALLVTDRYVRLARVV
jgi:putative spermidine/putrescine transport system permease protein